mmetsp:Transcript_12149/g.35538  ORF Transcript_12149/g.35538 Transcript_12149/m.35538 type:complete len:324 (+) Transcript_12149:3157-4128(+)
MRWCPPSPQRRSSQLSHPNRSQSQSAPGNIFRPTCVRRTRRAEGSAVAESTSPRTCVTKAVGPRRRRPHLASQMNLTKMKKRRAQLRSQRMTLRMMTAAVSPPTLTAGAAPTQSTLWGQYSSPCTSPRRNRRSGSSTPPGSARWEEGPVEERNRGAAATAIARAGQFHRRRQRGRRNSSSGRLVPSRSVAYANRTRTPTSSQTIFWGHSPRTVSRPRPARPRRKWERTWTSTGARGKTRNSQTGKKAIRRTRTARSTTTASLPSLMATVAITRPDLRRRSCHSILWRSLRTCPHPAEPTEQRRRRTTKLSRPVHLLSEGPSRH